MPGPNHTVILVEDEPLLSNLLKKRLEKEGVHVVDAHDGEEGLKAIRENDADLVLLDIILPKLSGFEVMQKIKEDPQLEEVPILVVSNLGQDSDVEKGKELGAVGYFVKAHVSIDDLVGEVKKYLSGESQK